MPVLPASSSGIGMNSHSSSPVRALRANSEPGDSTSYSQSLPAQPTISLSPIPDEEAGKTGTANIWTAMSYDPALGLLYIPVSSPSPNYWGGNRTQPIPLGTSTTALDINTGKVVWSRQWVHHDLWDYDINSAVNRP